MKKGCKSCVYNRERTLENKKCLKDHRAIFGYDCKDYAEKKNIWEEEEFFAECRNAGKNVKGDENMNFENIKVKNKHGQELDFEVVTNYMDNDIREYLHGELAPCSPQLFYDAYCTEHKIKFGEMFFTEEGGNITW